MHSYKFKSSFRQQTNNIKKKKNNKLRWAYILYICNIYWHVVLNI